MGSLSKSPTNSHTTTLQDLKVTLKETKLIFPNEETKKRSLFLTNIDQVLNFDVQTVHFFPANNEFPIDIVAEKLKVALAKVLVPYDFIGGRIKMNNELGRLEIECNGGGVGFVLACSEYSLSDVGDLVYPNPAFAQLIVSKIVDDLDGGIQQPLCIFQVTSFKCGGFTIGISTNHVLFDGISFKMFLQNLASQAFDDKPLAVIPCNDRHLLTSRSPPRVTFPHPELLKLKIPIGEESAPVVFGGEPEQLDFSVFRMSSDDVTYLKDKAKEEGGVKKITGFNVVTAHVWRCKALSCDTENNMERPSTVLYAVDIRPRVKPPLPASYTGNAVLTAYATATCKELKDGPFSKLVEMVSEGANRMTDEYARSAIDWGEIYKGFPHGEFLISSWWKLGFAEMVYPWGKPIYSCPVVYHRKDIILLFPDMEDGVINNNAVNVLVALPHKEMERFQKLFHELLA